RYEPDCATPSRLRTGPRPAGARPGEGARIPGNDPGRPEPGPLRVPGQLRHAARQGPRPEAPGRRRRDHRKAAGRGHVGEAPGRRPRLHQHAPEERLDRGTGSTTMALRTRWSAAHVREMAAGGRLGLSRAASPRKFVIDYSSPNVAK